MGGGPKTYKQIKTALPVAEERRQEGCFWGYFFCFSCDFWSDFEYFNLDRKRVI